MLHVVDEVTSLHENVISDKDYADQIMVVNVIAVPMVLDKVDALQVVDVHLAMANAMEPSCTTYEGIKVLPSKIVVD